MSKLHWVRAKTFLKIPPHLFKIKGVNIRVDKIYAFDYIAQDPYNLLFLLEDEKGKVKGFCWSIINPIDNALHVNILSVEKELYNKGIVKEVYNMLKKIKDKLELDKIEWRTTRPNAFKKLLGAKVSATIMEV